MSAKQLIEEKIARKLKERPEIAKGIGVAIAIDLTGAGGGRWVIDMSGSPAKISMDRNAPVTTTISMETDIFEKMAAGELDPQMAFLSGKVKVDGNLGVAIKLGQLLT